MMDDLDRSAILALLVRRERAYYQRISEQKKADDAKAALARADEQINSCHAALKDLFGIDLSDLEMFAAVRVEYETEVVRLARAQPFVSEPGWSADAEALPPPAAAAIPEPLPRAPISQLVLARLQEAGDEGSKAATIRQWIEEKHGLKLHEKTVGMTLYRLLRRGRVRRDRHTWFFVPETKNPAGDTAGLEDLLK